MADVRSPVDVTCCRTGSGDPVGRPSASIVCALRDVPPASASPPAPVNPRQALELRLLVRLRWLAVAAQTALVLGSGPWDAPAVPLSLLGLAVLLVAASNWWLHRLTSAARPSLAAPGVVIALDTLLLTALLASSGGVVNPFSALYLLQVVLAALLAPFRWAWGIWVLGGLCWGALFLIPSHHLAHMGGHLVGMWAAYLVLGPFFAFALTRLRAQRAALERRLSVAREQQDRSQRLASLATLATGAAHELSTPLGTIAVIAHELRQSGIAADPTSRRDLDLICQAVDRCVDVLGQMSSDAGSSAGEAFQLTSMDELFDELLAPLSQGARGRVRISKAQPRVVLPVPRRLLARALRGLVKNALEASPLDSPVCVRSDRGPDHLRIEVLDRGPGMSPEVQSRATEPFFTTKGPGGGMGLGLFYARSVVEFLGGHLELSEAAGGGTLVAVILPLDGEHTLPPGSQE